MACLTGLPNQFVYDDVSLIEENQRAHTLAELYRAFAHPYWPPPFAPQLYRPIASAFLAFEYFLGAGQPVAFRVFSYLLYACAGVAVLRLVRTVLPRPAALIAALVFAAHPVHVEATALGVNQGELIVALAACVMATMYINARSRHETISPATWSVLAAIYAAAALTKENGFIIPGLLVASEVTVVHPGQPISDRSKALWKGYVLLGVVAVSIFAVRFVVLGAAAGAVPADALVGVGFMNRLLTMLQVVPTWFRLLLWPVHLQADYSPNELIASTRFGPREAAGLFLLIAAGAAAWLARRRVPAITLGVLWCGISLFPVSNLLVPTGVVVAERTLFLPSAGACLALGGAWWALQERFGRLFAVRRIVLVGVTLLVCFGAFRSARRQLVWRNSHRLAVATLLDAPKSLRVQRAHREAVEDLVTDYQRRVATASQPWLIRNELAALLRYMKEDSLAVIQLRLSVQENPRQPEVQAELSRVIRDLKARAR